MATFSTQLDSMYGATTYGTSSTFTTTGDVMYWSDTPKGNTMEYDWSSPDYWSKQRAPLRTAQEQYLLQQAQREEFHKYKRPEKTYTEAELKAKLKEAYAKTTYPTLLQPKVKSPIYIDGAEQTFSWKDRTIKPTPLMDMWRKTDEWLSTVHIH